MEWHGGTLNILQVGLRKLELCRTERIDHLRLHQFDLGVHGQA